MQLAICEIYNRHIHGATSDSSANIDMYWLASDVFSADEFFNDVHLTVIYLLKGFYNRIPLHKKQHRHIRNYEHIIRSSAYFQLNIVQVIELSGGEHISIIKTCYLKMFQRKYRAILKNRMMPQ